jgi:hypothetical protein
MSEKGHMTGQQWDNAVPHITRPKTMPKKEKCVHCAFRSSLTMDNIPVTQDDVHFIVEQVRAKFPMRRFRPKIKFSPESTSPGGRLGEAYYPTNTITLWRKGMNLNTVLHEIAHLLSTGEPGHNKDFYFTCELLEKELF